jgi:hypothetical protein
MTILRRAVGGWLGLAGVLLALSACAPPPAVTPTPTNVPPSPTPAVPGDPGGIAITPRPGQELPYAAQTATPGQVVLPWETASPGPSPTGAPIFPTLQAASPIPAEAGAECDAAFPLAVVGRIATGTLTIEQVIAAFGPVIHVSGRPPVYRFELDGCTLRVTVGAVNAQAAEVEPYAPLSVLVDQLGPPEAAASAPASLRLPGRDRLALLYPAQGVIALFEHTPLALDDPVETLQIVPAGTLDELLARLGPDAQIIEGWTLPVPVR